MKSLSYLLIIFLASFTIFTFSIHPSFADVSITISQGSSSAQTCVASNNCFNPPSTQISLGDTVTWTNVDTVSHTITSGNPSDAKTGTIFDSGLVKSGGTFAFKFSNSGIYTYYCQIHPWMTGQVIVGGTKVQSPTTSITVSTDKISYKDGDTLTISGTASDYIPDTPIYVVVRNPIGHVVLLTQVFIGADKTYSATITTGGSLWKNTGTYEVDVQFGSPNVSSTTKFQFSGSSESPTPEHITATSDVGVISTKYGNIIIKFRDDVAPKTVANFEKLAKSGFYDGTIFHRIIPGFVIQGGDPNTKSGSRDTWGLGNAGYTIPAEFSNLKHTKYMVSMARSSDINSASCQFFIVVGDATFLDGKYTIFGEVISGQDAVDKIASIKTDSATNQPIDPEQARISKVTIQSEAPTLQSPDKAVPEFPFAVPVLIISIVSMIAFYRIKSKIRF